MLFNLLLLTVLALALAVFRRWPETHDRFLRSVAIDTRSLAIFRILVGLLILGDVVVRLTDLTIFYSEKGVVPREMAIRMLPEWGFSLFLVSGDQSITIGLFILHFLFGLLLLIGYRTRVMVVLALVFAASLDYRNPLVLSYADKLFVLLLFWAVFLPLGERWSLDALHSADEARGTVSTPGSLFILLQVVLMYLVNAFHKAESELWKSGEASVLILGLDDTSYLVGDYLRVFPEALQFGGLGWYFLLWASPLLLVFLGRPRALLALMLMVGHFLFAISVRIGAFSFVAIAGLVLFLQSEFWEALERRFAAYDDLKRSIVGWVVGRPLLEGQLVPQKSDARSNRLIPLQEIRSILVTVFVLTAGISMVVGNMQAAGVASEDHELVIHDEVEAVNTIFRINQPTWSVFAPNPRTTDYYYVFPAVTETGRVIDAYNERPMSYERPYDSLNRQYESYRHRFYMNSVRRAARGQESTAAHLSLARYYCENWDFRGEELTRLNMYVVAEKVSLDTVRDHSRRTKSATLLYRHSCSLESNPTTIQPPDGEFGA